MWLGSVARTKRVAVIRVVAWFSVCGAMAVGVAVPTSVTHAAVPTRTVFASDLAESKIVNSEPSTGNSVTVFKKIRVVQLYNKVYRPGVPGGWEFAPSGCRLAVDFSYKNPVFGSGVKVKPKPDYFANALNKSFNAAKWSRIVHKPGAGPVTHVLGSGTGDGGTYVGPKVIVPTDDTNCLAVTGRKMAGRILASRAGVAAWIHHYAAEVAAAGASFAAQAATLSLLGALAPEVAATAVGWSVAGCVGGLVYALVENEMNGRPALNHALLSSVVGCLSGAFIRFGIGLAERIVAAVGPAFTAARTAWQAAAGDVVDAALPKVQPILEIPGFGKGIVRGQGDTLRCSVQFERLSGETKALMTKYRAGQDKLRAVLKTIKED